MPILVVLRMDHSVFQFANAKKEKSQIVLNTNTYFVLNCNVLSLFTFYALPSGGKSKDAVVHWQDSCALGVNKCHCYTMPEQHMVIPQVAQAISLDSHCNNHETAASAVANLINILCSQITTLESYLTGKYPILQPQSCNL